MNEIERAIQEFEDNAYHTSMKPTISEASKAVALRILRAELSRQENAPLTWNERINQMTVEEKARLLVVESSVIRNIGNGEKEYPVWITPLVSGVAFTSEEAAINFNKNKLASPYTEGETK